MVEICTGLPVLRDGNLISGLSIRTILFFGTGIVTVGCTAVMIACIIVISFLIYYYLISGLGSPMNYKGITAADSGNARLSGKIPERSEDDFSRNR